MQLNIHTLHGGRLHHLLLPLQTLTSWDYSLGWLKIVEGFQTSMFKSVWAASTSKCNGDARLSGAANIRKDFQVGK